MQLSTLGRRYRCLNVESISLFIASEELDVDASESRFSLFF